VIVPVLDFLAVPVVILNEEEDGVALIKVSLPPSRDLGVDEDAADFSSAMLGGPMVELIPVPAALPALLWVLTTGTGVGTEEIVCVLLAITM
jgi:hypothetical protein